MKKQSTNIICDGNYLFYKSLFSYDGFGGKGKQLLSTEEDVGRFIRKVATDLAYTLNFFPGYDRVIFTMDSRSWRKDVTIVDGGYKTNREKDESTVDWNRFYEVFNEFAAILESHGAIISRIPRAEGDDLMYLWGEYLFNHENNDNAVVFTGDGDLSQIVKHGGSNYVVVFNTKSATRAIIAKNGFTDWIKETKDGTVTDILNLNMNVILQDGGVNLIESAMNRVPVQELDPDGVALRKVLCGDGGDTIPSIHHWLGKKGQTVRVTNRHFQYVFDFLQERYGRVDISLLRTHEKYQDVVRTLIEKSAKIVIPPDVFRQHLDRNIHLVWLSEETIPSDIQEAFRVHADATYPTRTRKIDKFKILEGTSFEKASETVIRQTSDVFKYL